MQIRANQEILDKQRAYVNSSMPVDVYSNQQIDIVEGNLPSNIAIYTNQINTPKSSGKNSEHRLHGDQASPMSDYIKNECQRIIETQNNPKYGKFKTGIDP